MPTKQITREQVLEAAKGAANISEVARRLGLCGATMPGRTGRLLRNLAPGIDGMVKATRGQAGAASTEPKQTAPAKVTADKNPAADNPYRPGSTYGIIFDQGSRRYRTRQTIVEEVAAMTGKPPRCIAFSLAVLCRKAHSSNGGRSASLADGKERIKLIALKRKHPCLL